MSDFLNLLLLITQIDEAKINTPAIIANQNGTNAAITVGNANIPVHR
jgi:hypothetical protein